MQNSYQYQTEIEWTGQRSCRARSEGLPDLRISSPLEFAGEPGTWTPEHLLVVSVESCLMTTFLAIANLSKLDVVSYRSRTVACLEKVPEEGYRFTTILLAPEIEIADADLDRARRILHKAEKHCFISNSIRAKIEIEPRFYSASSPNLEMTTAK